MRQKEKTGEMEVLRPGVKDGMAWVDRSGVVVALGLQNGCDPLFWFVGGARERKHRAQSRGQSGLAALLRGNTWAGQSRQGAPAARKGEISTFTNFNAQFHGPFPSQRGSIQAAFSFSMRQNHMRPAGGHGRNPTDSTRQQTVVELVGSLSRVHSKVLQQRDHARWVRIRQG